MSIQHLSVALLSCNRCYRHLGEKFVDPQEARFWLKSIGGYSSPRHDYDLCPDCRVDPDLEHEFVERVAVSITTPDMRSSSRTPGDDDLCVLCGRRRKLHMKGESHGDP